ncbi:helix-turn-helix domain-containing protein [Poseidonibacter antarcticus]|uniref:helix-turn-helix domain-containing protein n=1 Tax=Poseidonibacter antarcticus TaxID=2478538 RepID=UPI000EF4F895|nr:helix-turn-helix transcriptional regulator [Poseidonibacter antarcticus]
MLEFKTSREIEDIIAKRIKSERLRQNITQSLMAKKTGMALSTYKKFEHEGKGTFDNFIRILMGLGRITEIDNFLKEPEFSPKVQIKSNRLNKKVRVRASSEPKVVASNKNDTFQGMSPFQAIIAKAKKE